jgi:hypothetical protein
MLLVLLCYTTIAPLKEDGDDSARSHHDFESEQKRVAGASYHRHPANHFRSGRITSGGLDLRQLAVARSLTRIWQGVYIMVERVGVVCSLWSVPTCPGWVSMCKKAARFLGRLSFTSDPVQPLRREARWPPREWLSSPCRRGRVRRRASGLVSFREFRRSSLPSSASALRWTTRFAGPNA